MQALHAHCFSSSIYNKERWQVQPAPSFPPNWGWGFDENFYWKTIEFPRSTLRHEGLSLDLATDLGQPWVRLVSVSFLKLLCAGWIRIHTEPKPKLIFSWNVSNEKLRRPRRYSKAIWASSSSTRKAERYFGHSHLRFKNSMRTSALLRRACW